MRQTSAATVEVDGVARGGVSIGALCAGTICLLDIAPTILKDQTVRLSYADPTPCNHADALQDPNGNDMRSFEVEVRNGSIAGMLKAPTGLTATGSSDRIELSWTTPTDTGDSEITGYRIEWSPTGNRLTSQTLSAIVYRTRRSPVMGTPRSLLLNALASMHTRSDTTGPARHELQDQRHPARHWYSEEAYSPHAPHRGLESAPTLAIGNPAPQVKVPSSRGSRPPD